MSAPTSTAALTLRSRTDVTAVARRMSAELQFAATAGRRNGAEWRRTGVDAPSAHATLTGQTSGARHEQLPVGQRPLAEVQRFINVPMRWCEQYPARERRELWVTAARPGHQAHRPQPPDAGSPRPPGHRAAARRATGGALQLTTGKQVNYIRAIRRCCGGDAMQWPRCWPRVGGIAAFALAGGVMPLGVVAATLTGAPGAVAMRWLARPALAQRATDRA